MKRSTMMLGALGVLIAGCSSTVQGDGRWGPLDNQPDESSPEPPDPGESFPTQDTSQKGPQPTFSLVHQAEAPPAISGGTLLVAADGDHVVAADPDRDRIYIASLAKQSLVTTLAVHPHDEPGRLAEDDAHRIHVALRRGGAVVSIDPVAGTILARRAVCPSPRGIALDVAASRMIVACEGGELYGLPTDPTGAPALIARLDRDLRDVVVTNGHVYVSRFRSAEMLDLSPTGAVLARSKPKVGEIDAAAQPTLAWRMIAAPPSDPSSQPVVVHQVAGMPGGAPVKTDQGGYGGGGVSPTDCQPTILSAAISHGSAPIVRAPTQLVLPVDVATDGTNYAVVAAGNGHTAGLPQVFVLSTTGGIDCGSTQMLLSPSGQAVAIQLLPGNNVIVQSREPAQLEIMSLDGAPAATSVIALSSESREDTGHAIFHANSGSGIACASCHGEGGDDGHVWTFDQEGSRRTPSLRGTLDGTAPYHWNGEMEDISQLTDAVMTGRMNGPALGATQKSYLQGWLFAQPALPAPSGLDAAAVARGKTLFGSDTTACATCHGGAMLTNSTTVSVGTGGKFQVPSLVGVSARAPFLHDGCAATLTDRFGKCGGVGHGDTSALSAADIADLVAYLQSL